MILALFESITLIYTGTSLKIYAKPRTLDITSTQNVILNILENDVDVSIEQIRE